MKWVYSLVFLILFVSCSIGDNSEGKEVYSASYLPKELETQTDGAFEYGYGAYGITEHEFNDVLDTFESIFQPVVQRLGFSMEVERFWDDNTINAYAQKNGRLVKLSFFGGLARHKYMTKLGFALVVSHELGHIVGGYPFYRQSNYMAVEGQSDLYAASAAGKILLKNLSSYDSIAPEYGYEARDYCSDSKDQETCVKVLEGGISLGRVLASLGREPMPSYSRLDTVAVKRTMETHPRAQCRLTQYFLSALCNKDWNFYAIPMTRQQSDAASCQKAYCWYAG